MNATLDPATIALLDDPMETANVLDTLKGEMAILQRDAAHSEECKTAQKTYEQALSHVRRQSEAEKRRQTEAEKKAQCKAHDFSRQTPRTTASISLGVYPDYATSQGYGAALQRWEKAENVMLGYVMHDEDGSPLCESPDQYPCRITSLAQGAYVSDQPNGTSGWHLIAQVELPEELRHATRLARE
jgi:ElaB/YqjD/DUF883 family membrane-anchored ribosome-binding protein